MAIRTVLVANRGEIARRVISTCRSMGIASVAVFSDADADAAHVHDADMAVGLGGAAPADSYLRGDAIIDAAVRTNADAIHPGYGFLSENAEFAAAVADAGIVFIGPGPAAIAAMGSKIEAKWRMADAGVPLLPSVQVNVDDDDDVLRSAAENVGFPLLVKASAGGGGRGMRLVDDLEGVEAATRSAAREAGAAFGDDTVYFERFVSPARHIEVQILGDDEGRIVHFGERECSVQRRHQKVIEEAPAASLDDSVRAELHAAAVRAGEAIGYTNAGTVEFLVDPDGGVFFLEVNTRLQVEHPVTEAVFGVDLVALQIEVAAGQPVPDQSAIGPPSGHAIEARLYAEDPVADYAPSTGAVHRFAVPDGVRVDSAIDGSGVVTAFYDAMIAKVIAHQPTRHSAAAQLASALRRTEIVGIRHNAALLVRTLEHPEFLAGEADTGFLERHGAGRLGAELVDESELANHLLAAAVVAQERARAEATTLGSAPSGFRNVPTIGQRRSFRVGEKVFEVEYRFADGALVEASVDGRALDRPVAWSADSSSVDLSVEGVRRAYRVQQVGAEVLVSTRSGSVALHELPRFVAPEDQIDPGSLVASMPGTVRAVEVAVGDEVVEGQSLVVIEAMKMEMAITAVAAGVVESVEVSPGDTVDAGTVLVTLA